MNFVKLMLLGSVVLVLGLSSCNLKELREYLDEPIPLEEVEQLPEVPKFELPELEEPEYDRPKINSPKQPDNDNLNERDEPVSRLPEVKPDRPEVPSEPKQAPLVEVEPLEELELHDNRPEPKVKREEDKIDTKAPIVKPSPKEPPKRAPKNRKDFVPRSDVEQCILDASTAQGYQDCLEGE